MKEREGVLVGPTVDPAELARSRMMYVEGTHPGAPEEDRAAAEAAVSRWIDARLSEGNLYGAVGKDASGRIVCGGGALVYELPPLMGQLERAQAHILSVWVDPDRRGAGLGRAVMEELMEEGKRRGIFRFFLNATAMGEPLYRALGFKEQEEKALILKLRT